VAHVLEGSVRKQGDRIRITAQLIKVEDGFHVWSQNYDRKLDDIFAVQDEISAAIATALSSRLAGASGASTQIDPVAYDTYLRARQLLANREGGNIRQAARLFAEVNARAPAFDAAWSGKAKALALVNNYEGGALGDLPAQSRAAGERALELNPDNAEALIMMAFVDALYFWRWDDARREAKAAIALAPNDAEIANFAGDNLRFFADPEAVRWEQRAAELDPLADFNHSDLGWVRVMDGHPREALVDGERARRIDPTYWTAYDMMARAHFALGDYPRALEQVELLAKQHPGSVNELELRARLAFAQGDAEGARKYLGEMEARGRAGEPVWFTVAVLQAMLGDTAAAAASLRRAIEVRDPTFVADVEFFLPSRWPRDPAIQAVFTSPELAPLFSARARNAGPGVASAPAP
jgi:tetratricopeptide (TPR) repeat protein